MKKKLVSIIMGSDSDLDVVKESCEVLDSFDVIYELDIVSAHRTPAKMYAYGLALKKKKVQVIICAAGGSAHLPGMIASLTTIPVIGLPIKTKSMNGLDSLLSIVQMPPGIPVATVAVNGAKNAALLAIQILSLHDDLLEKKITKYKNNLKKLVDSKSSNLLKVGYKKYKV
jgi:5-(carboxyamino)imidazole ribonucleotide mutase